MGLFRRNKPEPTSGVSAEFQRALDDIRPLDINAEFPDATPDQAATMEQVWTTVVSKVGGAGTFDPQQMAAIDTLCGRLAAENPSLAGFRSRLVGIAQQETQRRPDDPAWRYMANKF